MIPIMFSRVFPAYHYKKGEPTFFVEKIMASLADNVPNWTMYDDFVMYDWHQYYNATAKHHTIRAGNRWKAGDFFAPKIWTGDPYRSKQLQFAAPIEVKKVYSFEILNDNYIVNGKEKDLAGLSEIAKNDGLMVDDFELWFAPYTKKGDCICQIICWNENINY